MLLEDESGGTGRTEFGEVEDFGRVRSGELTGDKGSEGESEVEKEVEGG